MRAAISKSVFLAFLLSGCSIFNPYKSDFSCPVKENGKCVPMSTAYKESKGEVAQPEKAGQTTDVNTKTPSDRYQEAVLNRMTALIEAPRVPIVAPPKVARVLILPYEGGDTFYSERYLYILLKRPEWVLSTGNPAQLQE